MKQLNLNYIAIHQVNLNYIAIHQVNLNYIAIHQLNLNYIAIHQLNLNYIAIHQLITDSFFVDFRITLLFYWPAHSISVLHILFYKYSNYIHILLFIEYGRDRTDNYRLHINSVLF